MLNPAILLTMVMMLSLTFYALFGGADYGGGVWDLLARGRRQREQRKLIADAITPVWEANHVWLIFVIVLLFSGFPPAFAAITTALHIPLTALIIGRDRHAGFVICVPGLSHLGLPDTKTVGRHFCNCQHHESDMAGNRCRRDLGGKNRCEGRHLPEWLCGALAWSFPLTVGFFALALFMFLAAMYLTMEARDRALQEDFRKRSLLSGAGVALMALVTFLVARSGAPDIYHELLKPSLVWIVQGATAISAVTAFVALLVRTYKVARVAAMLQVTCILWGWGASQAPYFLQGHITIIEAAASPSVLWPLIAAAGAGLVLLFPSLWYLLRIFKTGDQQLSLH